MKNLREKFQTALPLLLLAFIAGWGISQMQKEDAQSEKFTANETPTVFQTAQAARKPLWSREGSVALSQVAEKSIKSVVNIASIRIVRVQESPFFNDPFFRYFFGQEMAPFGAPREKQARSLGSGVIVSKDGYILTNNHVISRADSVTVTLHDGTEKKAEIIGADPLTDVALIKVEDPKGFQPMPMGNSDKIRLAEVVLAIGSPFELNHTVTQGIISALGRSNIGIAHYEDFIQTDAAINRGNSGGPLINLEGELIGINTAILSQSGGSQGVGLAIPINMARYVMNELIKNGKVERGWLGIRSQKVTEDIAKALNLKARKGALISHIYKGSPAEKAGLKPGDLIQSYNGEKINDFADLKNMLSETAIGKKVEISFIRDQKSQNTTAKIEKHPEIRRPRRRG